MTMNPVIEVLEFIFQDFWHWLGTLLLLGAIFKPLFCIDINKVFKNNKDTENPKS